MPNRKPQTPSVSELVEAVTSFDRAGLGRAITLIESKKAEHKALAHELLRRLYPEAGKAHRIGVTGVPGVGKSTFIDQLGCHLTGLGHRVAVLAVDPSSSRTGGAILGDKTRMAKLAASDQAFIRPSPSSGTLGGVTRTTRETILLCEAAGCDVILVETVGVGQSEVAVGGMVDFFLVLMLAGSGDELQGIKKGVMELADMVAITKADGENAKRAAGAAADFRAALHILTPPNAAWKPPVVTISALENRGLDELWHEILRHKEIMMKTGAWQEKRREQDVSWMGALIEEHFRQALFAKPAARAIFERFEATVRTGATPPSVAADEVISELTALRG